jgi:hypothetical protein
MDTSLPKDNFVEVVFTQAIVPVHQILFTAAVPILPTWMLLRD